MMNLTQSDIAGLYSLGNVRGASSLGLVVALYDTILRDLRRASGAITQGNIEKRTFELNHALRVIAELENVLDYERGGKAAAQLQRFYATTRGMILEASIRANHEGIIQLVRIFSTMRQAWHEADKKMSGKTSPSVAGTQKTEAQESLATRMTGVEAREGPPGNWRA